MRRVAACLRYAAVLLILFASRVPAQQVAADTGLVARAGDRVALRIWNEPEMSDTFTVAANGEVILPRLGSVSVQGRSIAALQTWLRGEYARFLRNPSVEITVLRRIGIQGQVARPGLYLADLTMALPDVITLAGGFTEAANPRHIVVDRDGRRFRLSAGRGSSFLVATLHSGDIVTVKPRSALMRNPLGTIGGVMTIITTFILVYSQITDDGE